MSDSIAVRPATTEDLEPLAALFEQYRAFYHCSADARRAREFLGERLRNTDSVILVAADDGRRTLAGFTQLYPTFSSLRMGRALVLNDLYVAEPYRRAGVARRLMDAARLFAEMSGAVAVTLEKQRDNARARALYDALGYRAEDEFLTYSLASNDIHTSRPFTA